MFTHSAIILPFFNPFPPSILRNYNSFRPKFLRKRDAMLALSFIIALDATYAGHLRIKGDAVKRQPGQRRSSRGLRRGHCVNYEGCARPFPAQRNEIRRCKFEFHDPRHDRFETAAWNIIWSSSMGTNRIGKRIVIRLCGSIIQWIAKTWMDEVRTGSNFYSLLEC